MIWLSIFLSAWVVSAHAKDVVIRNDRGGIVEQYANYYHKLYLRGDRVVIDGYCASSCTLALALPNTCVTKRAILGFHAAYLFGWFGDWSKWEDYSLTNYFMSQYPNSVRGWLNARGGLTPDMKYVRAPEIFTLVPRCK